LWHGRVSDGAVSLPAPVRNWAFNGDWGLDAGDEDGMPDYYLAQVEWQLSVTGLKTAYIAVLIAGNDFRIYKIHHDPVLEGRCGGGT